MRVLFVARRFPPSVGGMERFAQDLNNNLAKKVAVVAITWGGSNKWLPIVLPWFFIKAFFILLFNRRIEVIHMQDAVQAPIGWLLGCIFKKPFIVVAHGLDITYKQKFYQATIIRFVKKAARVICISAATREECIKRGIDSGILEVITLGVSDDYGGNPTPDRKALAERTKLNLDDKKIIITTGRLVKRKGVSWFIKNALPAIVKNNKDTMYVVAGSGEQRDRICEAISESGLESYVKLLGSIDDGTKSILYQSADIFVMPNIVVPNDMEGFGIVAHEAAMAGIPVVASKLQGIIDAISDRKNGILVKPGDADSFVKQIDKLLGDGNYRRKFGMSARNYTMKNYGWENIASKYVKVYEEVVDNVCG